MSWPILGGRRTQSRGTTPPPPPPPSTPADLSNLNLVCDGNSLTAGVGGYPWPRGLPLTAGFEVITINGVTRPTTSTYVNIAVSGQTTRQMNGLDGQSAADVDGCWRDGMNNRLLPWEGTNSLANANRTVAQAVQDLVDYFTNRRALHSGWFIIAMTCLPRSAGSDSANTALNAKIDEYNAYLLANYKAMGADAVFDVRQAGSPFNLPNYAVATFENARNSTGLWADTGTDSVGSVTHLSSNGYHALTDQIIVPGIRRIMA